MVNIPQSESYIPDKIIKLLHEIINYGINIKFIRLDNSGKMKIH